MYRFLLIILFALLLFSQNKSKPCTSSDHRAFDFWVGDWVVKDKNGKIQGHNKIELILNDCVLLENWTGKLGGTGKSMNYYSVITKSWHQKWVDSNGIPLEFQGVGRNDSLLYKGEFTGKDGKVRLQKLTFSKENRDLVRQLWEQSPDGGKTWTTIFDGYYHRKK